MSEFISELKAAWVGNRRRKFYQSTRGIMTPEERQALEEEFERKLAEHDRQVAERAWDEGQKAGLLRADFEYGAIGYQHVKGNPHTRKEQT